MCLSVVVLMQSVGVAGMYLLSASEMESDVYGLLFFDWGWPEPIAQRIDDLGAMGTLVGSGLAIVAAGVLLGMKHRAASTEGRFLCVCLMVVLGLMGGWMAALASTQMVRGGAYVEYALGEHAVRIAVPIVLALLLLPLGFPRYRVGTERLAVLLLILASAATFVVHGYKAWRLYAPFTDLILLTDARCVQWDLSQSTAEFALRIIGVVDVIVALLLLGTRWRLAAGYMVVWGGITALSRMTAMGCEAWPETLIRSANWGAPLALLLYYQWRPNVAATLFSSEQTAGSTPIAPSTQEP